MGWRIRMAMAAALLACAMPAPAVVDLLGGCDQGDGSFHFTVVVVNDLVNDPTGYEIVLEQVLAGSCDHPSVAALTAMPLPDFQQEATFERALACPWPERTWRFQAALRHPDGSVELLGPFGDVTPVVALAWGDAPAVRGALEQDATGPYFHIVACDLDCGQWLCYDGLDLSRISPAEYETFLRSGEAVDVHGLLQAGVPSGGPKLYATRVEAARGDPCAPTPVTNATWGTLKAGYR